MEICKEEAIPLIYFDSETKGLFKSFLQSNLFI